MPSAGFTHALHDDAIVALGECTGRLCGAEAYVRLAQTCKRMKHLLLPDNVHGAEESASSDDDEKIDNNQSTVRHVIQARVTCLQQTPRALLTRHSGCDDIRTLHQLAVFERWCATPLHCDNRIPFPYGSTEITEPMHDQLRAATALLDRYPAVAVRLDVHCGTIAPPGVAGWFSAQRGRRVQRAIGSDDLSSRTGERPRESTIDPRRISVVPHGKKIALIVSKLVDHPFAALAQEGKGWVEVYLEVPGHPGDDGPALTLPPHPAYYNMAGPPTLEELMEEEDGLPAAFVWDDENGVDVEFEDAESHDGNSDTDDGEGTGGGT